MIDATVMPNTHWGLDIAYNFDAIQQNTNVCFAATPAPAGSYTCVGGPSLLETYGFYETHTQYGYFALNLTPIQRLNIKLGYSIVDNQGSTTMFNPLVPLGPLASTFQSPLAAVAFAVHRNVTFKAAWNYYQYGEDSFVGPTAPRYFHANTPRSACSTLFDRAAPLVRIRASSSNRESRSRADPRASNKFATFVHEINNIRNTEPKRTNRESWTRPTVCVERGTT
jgi:hypothetical protein